MITTIKTTKGVLFLVFLLSAVCSFSQYEITYWNDLPDHVHTEGSHHHDAIYETNCENGIYMSLKAGLSSQNVGVRIVNTSNTDLELATPLLFSAESSDHYSLLVAPTQNVLGPGEETSFVIQLDIPDPYYSQEGTLMLLKSNEGDITCPISIESGLSSTPGFTKSFSDAVIHEGEVTTLTFSIENFDFPAPSNMNFTDNLPAGLVVADIPNIMDNCNGGTVTAVPGSSVISYADGTSSLCGTCTISVDLLAIGTGTQSNVTTDLISNAGNSGTASDNIDVEPLPTFTKSFSPDKIPVDGMSTLTFTIDNTASSLNVNSFNFTDNLPAGVVVANPTNQSSTCGGGMLSTSPGSGTLSFVAGSVTAMSSCTVTVDVTSSSSGTYENTSENIAIGTLTGDSAVSELTVYAFSDASQHGLSFGDPCSCSDLLNCEVGGVFYFHDTLTVNTIPPNVPGLNLTVVSASDVYIEVPCGSGTNLVAATAGVMIPETVANSSGVYQLEFWKPSGSTPTMTVTDGNNNYIISASTFSPACVASTCAPEPIPTLGQWAIIVLILLQMIVMIVVMRRENLTKSKLK